MVELNAENNTDSLLEQIQDQIRQSIIHKDTSNLRPNRIFIIPVKERPFFPSQQLPVILDRTNWEKTFQTAVEQGEELIGLVFTKKHNDKLPKVKDFYPVGTLIRIHDVREKPDYIQFIAEGLTRFKVENFITDTPPFQANVTYPELDVSDAKDEEIKAYALALSNTLREIMPLNPLYSEDLKYFMGRFSIEEPADLADFAASITTANPTELQDILATFNLRERMEKTLVAFRQELEVTKLQYNIRERVEENLDDQQREFFLRQQLKEIQNELGIARDDRTLDYETYANRIKALSIDEKQKKKIHEEVEKLQFLEYGSPEYNVTRTYLDWVSNLPWGKFAKDKLDLDRAEKILNKGHYGLEDVKERILEFLAVGALKGEVAGSIILLVGPPGVGKTSIGRSIAETLGRPFFRMSVGGMRDEAEIKGHRRTYISAMPGKFIQAVKEAGKSNPVILLDEVDKIGSSYQGDPAAALLEVLDPEQNKDFLDHYLDLRYDLSKVLFIATANTLDTIPSPLLDRMEIIRLPGYITEEKVQIGKSHLWPELLKASGFTAKQLKITEAAIREVVEGYAREAGVRGLKKSLAKIIRKTAMDFVRKGVKSRNIGIKDIKTLLGEPDFNEEKLTRQVGVVTGLAWTSLGGAILNIEAARIHTRHRGFRLSGQLGEVMQESAHLAYSYISANLQRYEGDPKFFDEAFVHLHVPDGATPKDGPSAGITMATALLSLARGEMPKNMAMTGELSLTGQVLPIGGVREKVIAARRANIKELILPKDNKPDYDKLPDYIKEGITSHFAQVYDDVVKLVFVKSEYPGKIHEETPA